MPDRYNRKEVEVALRGLGYKFLSENDGQVLYQEVSQSPSVDLVLDWYKDEVCWDDLERQIKDQRLDAEPLRKVLTDNREG